MRAIKIFYQWLLITKKFKKRNSKEQTEVNEIVNTKSNVETKIQPS